MSSQLYKLWLNDAETDPLNEADVLKLVEQGDATRGTPARRIEDNEWLTVHEIQISSEYGPLVPKPKQALRRAQIRSASHYPILRMLLNISSGLLISVAILNWIAVVADDDHPELKMTKVIAAVAFTALCPFLVALLLLGHAALDFIDHSLSK